MSQFFLGVTSGNLPPEALQQVTTDIRDSDPALTPGTALVTNSNLNFLGGDSEDDDDVGIRTNADLQNGDNVFIELTNRLRGVDSVTGATTVDLITFNLGATPAVYRFNFLVAGISPVTGLGVGYTVDGSARTDGATSAIISTPDIDADEDNDGGGPNSLVGALMNLVASGNNVILQATGVAGQTINYRALGEYIVV